MCPGVCLLILTSFHSHGRRELGARNDKHYSDDKPFFPHASEQTHRPSNRRASKTDELRVRRALLFRTHMRYRNDQCQRAIALSIYYGERDEK